MGDEVEKHQLVREYGINKMKANEAATNAETAAGKHDPRDYDAKGLAELRGFERQSLDAAAENRAELAKLGVTNIDAERKAFN